MTNRYDLLDDALCLIDDDLLARVIAHNPATAPKKAHRMITLFGRQLPTVVATLLLVALIALALAAIPGTVKMVQLAVGFLTKEPNPAVTETETATETETVPETMVTLPEETLRMTSFSELRTVGLDSITIRTEPEKPDLARTFTETRHMQDMVRLLQNAWIEPFGYSGPSGNYRSYITILYSNGEYIDLLYADNACFIALIDDDGEEQWYTLGIYDCLELERLMEVETDPAKYIYDYQISGVSLDCGNNPAEFVEAPYIINDCAPIKGSYYRVPLLATLEAFGATIVHRDANLIKISYKGVVWQLWLSAPSLMIGGENVLSIASPYGVGCAEVSEDGREIMVDILTLNENILPAIRQSWEATVDRESRIIHLDPIE